mmetsp:Transcript_19904/g.46307  ORF Transcript_19904/g.46307 Transcript_19904/m.46307 type:complete len:1115 (+) Transcript_19904:49-3393(+)
MSSRVVKRGPLTVLRKQKVWHFVLFEDRLDYWNSSDLEAKGEAPKSRLAKRDIQGVVRQGSNNVFALQVQDGKSLEFQASSSEDLESWLAAFDAVLHPQASSTEPNQHPGSLCGGPLEIMRKGKAETRYCVLYDSRFDYYKLGQEDQPDPSGRIMFDDIEQVVETELGFIWHMAKGGKTMEFRAEARDAASKWHRAWSKTPQQYVPLPDAHEGSTAPPASARSETPSVGPTPLLEGTLTVQRGSKQPEPRYFALFQDHLQYHRAREDLLQGKEPRGLIDLSSLDQSCIEDISGGFQLTVSGRTLQLLTADAERWTRSLRELLRAAPSQPKPAPAAASLPPAETKPAPPPAETKPALPPAQPAKPAHTAAPAPTPEPAPPPPPPEAKKPAVAQRADVLHQGQLVLQAGSGGRSQPKWVILCPTVLQYFRSQERMERGEKPEMEIQKDDIEDLEILESGFAVRSSRETMTWHCETGKEDLQEWLSALAKVFDQETEEDEKAVWDPSSHKPEAPSGAHQLVEHGSSPVCQSSLAWTQTGRRSNMHSVLYLDRLEGYANLGDMVRGMKPVTTLHLEGLHDVEIDNTGFTVVLPHQSLHLTTDDASLHEAWVAGWNKVLERKLDGHAAGKGRLLHQGALVEIRKRGTERHYCHLHDDRLECYSFGGDAIGKHPRGTIRLADMTGFNMLDDGFVIHINGKRLELRVPVRQDVPAWVAAWDVAKTSIEAVGEGNSTTTDANSIVRHGVLGMQQGGRLVKKYFILYQGRLDYFPSYDAAQQSSATPEGRYWLKEMHGLQTVGCGLVLHLEGRFVGLHADTEASSLAWARALRTASLFNLPLTQSNADYVGTSRSAPSRSASARRAASARRPKSTDIDPSLGNSGRSRSEHQLPEFGRDDEAGMTSSAVSASSAISGSQLSKEKPRFNPMYSHSESRFGGAFWAHTGTSPNIAQRERSREPSSEPPIAGKITAPRVATTPRRRGHGELDVWNKISSSGDQASKNPAMKHRTAGRNRFMDESTSSQPSLREVSPWMQPRRPVQSKVTDAVVQNGVAWEPGRKPKASGAWLTKQPWEVAAKVNSWEEPWPGWPRQQKENASPSRQAGLATSRMQLHREMMAAGVV